MTKAQLIKWSAARDALNFVGIGQLPGLCWLLDLPLVIMHFNYAGPSAIFTLLETIPIIGFFPFFTVAAMMYPNHDAPEVATAGRVEPAQISSSSRGQSSPPVYALVDGKLVPMVLPDAEESEFLHTNSDRRLPGN